MMCYPEGLYEFDTKDRSAPDNNPPMMLRLQLQGKNQMAGLIGQLLSAIVNGEDCATFAFSGRLKSVDE